MSTVKRDGTVINDNGEMIGRVRKVARNSIASLYGAADKFDYQAEDMSGNPVGRKMEKRRDAVRTLEEYAKAPVAEFSIEPSARHIFGGGPIGETFVNGSIHWRGYTFSVSRYENESYWVVDFLMNPGAFFPAFSNGAGTRVTACHTLKGEVEEFVNAEFAKWKESRTD